MKKIKILSVLLLTLTLNSIAANAAVTTTKNKDGSVTITDTTTGKVTDIVNDDGSSVTDEQIAEGIADNASTNTNTNINKSTNTTNSVAVNVLKPVQNGWTQDSNGYWYYYKDSVLQTGWIQIGNDWYFLNPNGMMATCQWVPSNLDTYQLSSKWYYIGWDGKYLNNATNEDENEPKYGTVTLTMPFCKYYDWSCGETKFLYSDDLNKWVMTSVTKEFGTDDYQKYAKLLTPTYKGKNGEQVTVKAWIYLGKYSKR